MILLWCLYQCMFDICLGRVIKASKSALGVLKLYGNFLEMLYFQVQYERLLQEDTFL